MKYLFFLISGGLFLPLLLCTGASAEPPVLGKYLGSDNAVVRSRAIAEFHRLSPQEKETFVPDLLIAVDDQDPGVSRDASQLLQEMGVGARSETDAMKKQIAQDKTGFGDAPQKNEWAASPSDGEERFGAMRKEIEREKSSEFGKLSPDDMSPQAMVLEALKDPDPIVRSHAARALSTLHPVPVQAIPTLVEMLRDSDAETRGAAAAALGAMGPAGAPALPMLLKQLGDPDPAARQIIQQAVQEIQLTSR
jgi:HEAT repeat protein